MAPSMSRLNESRFEEVPRAKIRDLLKLLEGMMPKSAMLMNIAKLNLINQSAVNKFYSLDGNLSNAESAFVLNIRPNERGAIGPSYFVIMSHPTTIEPAMMTALGRAFDCSKSNVFVNIEQRYLNNFTELVSKFNPGKSEFPIATVYNYVLVAEQAARLDPETERQSNEEADSIVVKQLSVDDVATISPFWFGGMASEYIRLSIMTVASSGVYLKNELVSWALVTPCGTINFLYTKEGHRGKGFAELTMKYLCNYLGTIGLHAVMNVDVKKSEVSVPLLEYLGFELTETVNWLDNCPCRSCTEGPDEPPPPPPVANERNRAENGGRGAGSANGRA